MVEMGTFIAILTGTMLGSFINYEQGFYIICFLILSVALLGYYSSLKIPKKKAANPNLKIDFNLLRSTKNIISYTQEKKRN